MTQEHLNPIYVAVLDGNLAEYAQAIGAYGIAPDAGQATTLAKRLLGLV